MARPVKKTVDMELGVTVAEAAELLAVTHAHVHNMSKDGTIPPIENGRLPLKKTVNAYVQHCRGERKKNTVAGNRTGLIEEQTRKLKLENDAKEGLICDTDSVVDLSKTFVGAVQSELANWPARVTRDPSLRASLEKEVAASMSRIKDSVIKATNEIFASSDETEDEPIEDEEDDEILSEA